MNIFRRKSKMPLKVLKRDASVVSIIFGFFSAIGLALNMGYTYVALKKHMEVEYREVIVTLGASVLILSFTFVVLTIYFARKFIALQDLPEKNANYYERIRRNEIIMKHTAECIHNVLHYHRIILYEMDDYITNLVHVSEDRLKEILSEFEKYISALTANLQSYFSLVTDDRCAITIKIVKEVEANGKKRNKVKTFFRDPISCRRRRRADKKLDGSDLISDVTDNTALHVITSRDFSQTTFLCNDLREERDYMNRNLNWREYYFATAVVPISLRVGKNKRQIAGFLCVDNFKGNLANQQVEDFLLGIGDILFTLFRKYDTIITDAKKKGVQDERIELFTNWHGG